MNGPTGRFDPQELRSADGAPIADGEVAEAIAMARELGSLGGDHVRPSAGFVDAVMAAVEKEPIPAAVTVGGRAGRLAPLLAAVRSIRDAWAIALRGLGRPPAVRLAALVYVLAFAVGASAVVGAVSFGAAGALGILGDHSAPPSVEPSMEPSESAEPSVSVEPSESPEPSAEPSESAEPSDSAEPTETPEPSVKPSSRPSAGASPSDTPEPSSSDDHHSPEPSDTPKPSDTPH